MRSLWASGGFETHYPALEQHINTDVLVIGGGLCGLLCAYFLRQAGIDHALVEADVLCGGITKNTTAKITAQHGLIYHRLLHQAGPDTARKYFLANEAALKTYAQLCQRIDCDFERKDAYVYALTDGQSIAQEKAALDQLGFPAEICNALPLPFPGAKAIRLENQAQFHPLKFAAEISKNLCIYEHTRVIRLEGTRAVTENGSIQAKRILVATHFPFLNKHGAYFLKLYQHRSYVIALENAPQIEGMYVDAAAEGMSFRNYRELLLIGGGDHRTGKPGGGWEELRRFAKRYYPKATECFHWATQDCMSLDAVPYIGAYSSGTQGLYVATGFNKWGMTSAMVAAQLLTDLVQGKANAYSQLFSPSRSIFHPQLAVNLWESAVGLLTPKPRRCPHLGCALQWNPHEHSWDCPCHGSRFAEDGALIDNPAMVNLKK